MKTKIIGKCTVDKDGKILSLERDYFRQGMVFKDYDAYYNRIDDPCYVPELTDTVYTARNFLEMCNGQKDFADELFESVDWQHPESYMEECFVNEEWKQCDICGKILDGDEACSCRENTTFPN